jgi:hypothetical protein
MDYPHASLKSSGMADALTLSMHAPTIFFVYFIYKITTLYLGPNNYYEKTFMKLHKSP